MADILITWVVKTPQWDSIPGATVEVLGTTYKTISNNKGEYTLSFQHISPAVLRIRASAPNKMLWIHRIDVADHTVSSERIQSFEKGFTLAKAFTEISIDTLQKTIVGEGTSITEKGFLIITPYTKYLIPFNAIVKGDTPYKWKLKALIFEFDRQSSSYLLNADIFDQVSGLISQTLVTYGMPFVILTAENGARLDVLDTNPMTVWTTDRASRETENQLLDKETKSLFENAYQLSQSSPDEYPINSLWEYTNGNKKIVPLFWVFDRATGYWDNVGMRFVTNNFTAPYNIEAHFYTLRSQKK